MQTPAAAICMRNWDALPGQCSVPVTQLAPQRRWLAPHRCLQPARLELLSQYLDGAGPRDVNGNLDIISDGYVEKPTAGAASWSCSPSAWIVRALLASNGILLPYQLGHFIPIVSVDEVLTAIKKVISNLHMHEDELYCLKTITLN